MSGTKNNSTTRNFFDLGGRQGKPKEIPLNVQIFSYTVMILMAFSTVCPLVMTITMSLATEDTIILHGYTLLPHVVDFSAYKYILMSGGPILRSYGVTMFITVVGVVYGLVIMFPYAYVLSRQSFPWRRQFAYFIYFSSLFGGGGIPLYILITQYYRLQDTIWALVLPGCVAVANVYMMRTYIQRNIQDEVIESARIDGANESTILVRIVAPMAVPILGVIALFLAVEQWNSWINAFLYIRNNLNILPIQLLIRRIELNATFLRDNSGALGMEADTMREELPGDAIKMALVIITVLPILLSYPFFQKFFVRGITIGAVKG